MQKFSHTKRPTRTAIAIAITSVLGVMVYAPIGAAPRTLSPTQVSDAQRHQSSLQGPLLVGPVEAVRPNGKTIEVLGTQVRIGSIADNLLPSTYVAVYGTVSSDGRISASAIRVIDEVYAPGSSPVFLAGTLSQRSSALGSIQVGSVLVNGVHIPEFDAWTSSRRDSFFLVFGTQAISGGPIDAAFVIAVGGPGSVELSGTGILAIDGSGITRTGGSLNGLAIDAISPEGIFAIDGSGAPISIQAIDGSGAQLSIQAIDGSGAPVSIQAIDGSGSPISTQAIDGSGAPSSTQAIDGSGAPISIQAIDGSGAPISTQAIDGSGAPISIQAIDGSGAPVSIQAIDGSGAPISTQAIDGSGAPASIQTIGQPKASGKKKGNGRNSG